jgi:hypothetical protein
MNMADVNPSNPSEKHRLLAELASKSIEVDQAAQVLGCSQSQIWNLLRAGVLKRGVAYGNRTKITIESVRAALEVAR